MFNPHQRIKLSLRARRIRRRGDPEIARLAELAGGSRRAVDIGANRGVFTYWLARCAEAVEAFEPNPDLAARLAAAALANVTVHNTALSDAAGEMALFVPRHPKGGLDDPGGRLDAGGGPDGVHFQVACRTLDEFGFDDVDFLKIDVEGHEERVLEGAWQTIAGSRPVLLIELEERHRAGCLLRVRQRFGRMGYEMLFLDDGRWQDLGDLGPGQIGPSGRYINNFALLPAARTRQLVFEAAAGVA